ncbi:MAG: hypothetical protein IBJ00_08185 [Alphaproteobacteria bacterium]|nr:hypothetical protein [Alphaproteobacteria bacterium]
MKHLTKQTLLAIGLITFLLEGCTHKHTLEDQEIQDDVMNQEDVINQEEAIVGTALIPIEEVPTSINSKPMESGG